jgi:hypothetical protein
MGLTGLVVVDENSGTVIKIPFDFDNEWNHRSIQREQQIYERLAEREPGVLS